MRSSLNGGNVKALANAFFSGMKIFVPYINSYRRLCFAIAVCGSCTIKRYSIYIYAAKNIYDGKVFFLKHSNLIAVKVSSIFKLMCLYQLDRAILHGSKKIYLIKTKLFQLRVLYFSLLLIDERGRDKRKLKDWQKSEYPTLMLVISSREKLISKTLAVTAEF